MSFFETLDKIKFWANRFFWPTLFLIIGLILLNMAINPSVETLNNGEVIEVSQNSTFKYASLFFILASVIWFLYLFNVIRSAVSFIVMGVLAILAVGILYWDYAVIQDKLEYDAAYDLRDVNIQARMTDLKNAQLAYREATGSYTANIDTLIHFVKTGNKMKITKNGAIPARAILPEERTWLYGPKDNRPLDNLMTEVEAAALAKMEKHYADLEGFRRDTNYIPVMEAIFTDERYIESRNKIGEDLIPFYADSLRYVPFTKNEVRMDTSHIEREGVKIQTLLLEMKHPMESKTPGDTTHAVYTIGDLDNNHLRESWRR
jgi:hypothetical protein